MKKILVILIAVALSITAFAQGRILFVNDSLRLVYWNPDLQYSPPGFAGQAVNSDTLPPGVPALAADLYMGTSSSQLYLYSSTTLGPLANGAGRLSPMPVIANANASTGAPQLSAGTSVFVLVQVRPSNDTAPNTLSGPNGATFTGPFGYSEEFTFLLASGVTYPAMFGANGTWAAGTFNMDQYGVGSRGAIMVGYVPEPSTLALAGLAASVLLLRKPLISKHFKALQTKIGRNRNLKLSKGS